MNAIKKIMSMEWGEIWPLLQQARHTSSRSTLHLLQDLYACYKQGYTWADYFAYDFPNRPEEAYRESFICVNRHYPLITKHFGQTQEDNDFFNDKGLFNRNFQDLKGIETLDLRVDTVSVLQEFLTRHEMFFAKTPDGMGGSGVKRFLLEDFAGANAEEIYKQLQKSNYQIVEEAIQQHPEVAKLSENSVNTIRVVTCRDKSGNLEVPFVASRISVTEAYVDNGSMGGAYCILDAEGRVKHDYFTHLPVVKIYSENPINGFVFKNFQFPYYKEAIDLCKIASARCKGHYIGWDVAIAQEGPVLIEANLAPTPQLFQAINQLPNGLGRLETLENALKVNLRP